MRPVLGFAGAVAGLLATAAYGVIALTPPAYSLSRAAIIGTACLVGLIAVLWSARETASSAKTVGAVVLVWASIVGSQFFVWAVADREQLEQDKFAFDNLSTLSDAELKRRATDLANSLYDFEKTIQTNDPVAKPPAYDDQLTEAQRREEAREYSERIITYSRRVNIGFRRLYLAKVTSLIAEMQTRISDTTRPPDEARPGLSGMMAGVRPASALADYILALAQKLP